MYLRFFRHSLKKQSVQIMSIQKLRIKELAIANFFIKKAAGEHGLTNLKLNKLMYISLGYSLSILKYDLFRDNVEAWTFGPVIPTIYHNFKSQKNHIIKDEAKEYSPMDKDIFDWANEDKNWDEVLDFDESTPHLINYQDKPFFNDVKELLNRVWENYKDTAGYILISLTHLKGTPWSDARNTENRIIKRSAIKKYYDILIEKTN